MTLRFKPTLFCNLLSQESIVSKERNQLTISCSSISNSYCVTVQVHKAPDTHTPEISVVSLHSTSDSSTSFRASFCALTPLTAFGARRQSMMLQVAHRHEKLAPESGIEFMAPISGACVRGLTQHTGD